MKKRGAILICILGFFVLVGVIIGISFLSAGVWNPNEITNPLNDGLKLYFSFDSDDGSTDTETLDLATADDSQEGIVKYAKRSESRRLFFGESYLFNLSGGWITVGTQNLDADNITTSLWIRTPQKFDKVRVIYERGNHEKGYTLYIQKNSKLVLAYANDYEWEIEDDDILTDYILEGGFYACKSQRLDENTWYFITTVIQKIGTNEGILKLYINGTFSCSQEFYPVSENWPKKSVIGSYRGNPVSNPDLVNGYRGKIDEVMSWDKTLSSGEVQALYNFYFCSARGWDCGNNENGYNCGDCTSPLVCGSDHKCGPPVPAITSVNFMRENDIVDYAFENAVINLAISGYGFSGKQVTYTLYNGSSPYNLISTFSRTAEDNLYGFYPWTPHRDGKFYFCAEVSEINPGKCSGDYTINPNDGFLTVQNKTNWTACDLTEFGGKLPGNASWNDKGNNGIFMQTRPEPGDEFTPSSLVIVSSAEAGDCFFKCNIGYSWNETGCARQFAGPTYCWDIKNSSNCTILGLSQIAKNSLGAVGNNCGNYRIGDDLCNYSVSCFCNWNNTDCNPVQNYTLAEEYEDTCTSAYEVGNGPGFCEFSSSLIENNCNNTLNTLKFLQTALWNPNNEGESINCIDQTTIYPCPNTAKLPFFGSFSFIASVFVLIFIYLVYYNINNRKKK